MFAIKLFTDVTGKAAYFHSVGTDAVRFTNDIGSAKKYRTAKAAAAVISEYVGTGYGMPAGAKVVAVGVEA